ncbi:MAG: hypothetical protein JRG96_16470 [Deltaproteobacteria bacterium]|nr:hypothetical protein [Deltaproteobacteria bacterium]MBW2419759.1 hypothetical protein [Deltaproteobacteria bacterium]
MKRIITSALSAAMFLTIGLGEAQADTKTLAGFSCLKARGSGYTGESWGGIENLSTSRTVDVACPMVKDASKIKATTIMVRDGHASQAVRCRVLHVRRSYGASSGVSVYQTPYRYSSGWSAGYQNLNFWDDIGSLSGGHYFAYCTLPAAQNGRSSIESITYFE